MDKLKEKRRLKEFVGSQGTRERGLKVMHSRPCICAQLCTSTKDLKKSMAGHAYCAQSSIEDRKFLVKMHGCAFQPCPANRASAQTMQINSVFKLF